MIRPRMAWEDGQKVDLGTFGKRLSYSIKTSRITKKDIIQHIGITSQMLSDYENDIEKPQFVEMELFSELLKVPISWLMNGKHSTVNLENNPTIRQRKT